MVFEASSDEVSAAVVINPSFELLASQITKLLTRPSGYRHLIHTGCVFRGSGNWIIKDGFVSFANLAGLLKSKDIIGQIKEHPDTTFHINATKDGDWTDTNFAKQPIAKLTKFKFNPEAKLENSEELERFAAEVAKRIDATPLSGLLPASDLLGNIRFNNPTMYIFPSCQGNCALFGISGFTMLLDGGFSPNSCFWPFVRHLDQIDALLMSHLAENNLFGISSVLKRKDLGLTHPEIRCMLHNGTDKTRLASSKDSLHSARSSHLIDVVTENHKMMECTANLGVPVSPCVGKVVGLSLQPTNLYHKMGHGSLDMFVLNPLHDSKDLKDYVSTLKKSSGSIPMKGDTPLSSLASVSVVLIWRPASPTERVTRMLFPGAAPVSRLFEGMDKLKSNTLFQHNIQSELVKKDSMSRLKVGTGLSSSKGSLSSRSTHDNSRLGAKSHAKPGVGTKASARDVIKKPTSAKGTKKAFSPREKTSDKSSDQQVVRSPPLTETAPVAESSPIPIGQSADTPPSPLVDDVKVENGAAEVKDDETKAANGDEVKNGEEATSGETNAVKATEDSLSANEVSSTTDDQHVEVPNGAQIAPSDANASGDTERATDAEAAPPADVEQVKIEVLGSEGVEERKAEEDGTDGSAAAAAEGVQDESLEKEKLTNGMDEKDVDTAATSSPEVEAPKSAAEMSPRNGTAAKTTPGSAKKTGDKKPSSVKKATPTARKTPRSKTAPPTNISRMGDVKRPASAASAASSTAAKPAPKKAFSATATITKKAPVSSTTRKPPVGREATAKAEAKKPASDVSARGKKEAVGTTRKPATSARSDLNSTKRVNASMNESVRLNTSVSAAAGARAQRLTPVTPFYVELAYIPCNGDKSAVKLDFFRRVRAQFYVLSSLRPSGDVIDLLLEAKKTWAADSEMPVTVIPTYDTEDFRLWMRNNKDRLDEAHVRVEPSVNRCVIHLQGHDASCAAYRLEFDATLSHNNAF